eukprot:127205_1
MVNTEDLLAIPTVILSWISIYSCLYVIFNVVEPCKCPCKTSKICKLFYWCSDCCFGGNYNVEPISHTTQSQQSQLSMRNIIFFMCLTDLFQAIQIMLNWLPLCQAFPLSFWSETPCKILAIYAQFVAIQAPLWHCMLAYNLGYLVLGKSIQKLRKQRYYQYCIILIIPIICCILPILIDGINVYGMYINNNLNDKECWLVVKKWQLGFVSAIFISLLFHYIVLGILCFKSHQNNGNSVQYLSIIQRLMRFVIVYTLIRVLPAINRLWGAFANSSPPLWLILSHHICVASVGITNGIVWCMNERDEAMNQMKQKYRLFEQDSTCINSTDTRTTIDNTINIYDSGRSTPNIARFKEVTPQANWSLN